MDDLLVALALLDESAFVAACSTLHGLALFPESGCDIGIRYVYTLLEQRHEQERIFAHAIGETGAACAVQCNLSPFLCSIQLVKVVVDFEGILELCATIHPILNDEPLVLAHKWFQLCAQRRYRELARRIQCLEKGLSWHAYRLQVT